MKKTLFLTVFCAAVVLAQSRGGPGGPPMGLGRGPMEPGMGLGRTVTGAPYSAVEVRTEQQTLAGGNTIQNQHQTTISRDSQGRIRMETEVTRPGQTPTKRITIHDPIAGFTHELDPQNKTARSMPTRGPGRFAGGSPNGPLSPNGPGPRISGFNPRTPNPTADANIKTEDLGTQSINGVLATGTRTTHTIPAGTIGNAQPLVTIHERWVSTDLKVPVLVKTIDPRFGTTTTELTNIVRTEPDASLFTIPAEYTVTRGGPGGRGPRPQR